LGRELPAREAAKIIVLEPRRVAARQIASRMAWLLGEGVGDTVGYRIRFESRVSARTRVEVVTEGVLTRMLLDDPALEGVAVVVFDEFHERSLNTDEAFALTRQCQQLLRDDLRLVVMSATIDTATLRDALQCPVLESEGRMFPVEVIHTAEEADAQNVSQLTARTILQAHRDHEGDILAFLPGEGEIRRVEEMLAGSLEGTKVYPLYGLLSNDEQARAIAPSAPGDRKVVLATPIAETSLTIEGVRVVVDSGLCRKMVFDARSGLSHLETVRISMDMATQRTGRAGRVAPGVCYRLWSKGTEARMEAVRRPEILDADLTSLALDAALWGERDVERLPWLTPPPKASLAYANALLQSLGALDAEGRVTPQGRALSKLPCHPRIARMLLAADTPGRKALAADIAALLEEKDPLAGEGDVSVSTRLDALRRLVFVVGHHPAAEPAEPLGKGVTHVAVADDANGEVPQLIATVLFATPQPPTHLGVGTGDVVQQRQQQAHGMLAHGIAVALGTVEAAYSLTLGVFHIDGLHAGPYPADAAQRRHTVDERTVHHHLAPHHQPVASLRGGDEALVVVSRFHADFDASLAEPLFKHLVGAVGYQYLGHCSV
jgi:ATP-dependent helicase HrpB